MPLRRASLALCALLFPLAALAEEPEPQREGYAFDYPRILAQQRIFGLAHGVALLAEACHLGDAGTAAAYADWRSAQARAIEAARADLARYYFGTADVDAATIAQAMHLRRALGSPAGELEAACATLPQALRQPRYDFVARFRLEEQMARIVASVEADVKHEHCLQRFDDFERTVHEARYRLWREINEPVAQAAAEMLTREWPADGPAASYAEWIGGLRKETRARGDHDACLRFSASLKQPENFLRNVFRMPPVDK